MDTQEKEKIEAQVGIFSGYLDRSGIDSKCKPAQEILTGIANGDIKTFRESKIRLKDGSEVVGTTVTMYDGFFEEKAPLMKSPTYTPQMIENLAVLGFEAAHQWSSMSRQPSAVFIGRGLDR